MTSVVHTGEDQLVVNVVHGIHYTPLIVLNDKCSAGIADVQLTLPLG